MRVLLSTYGSRGDVQPMAALAVELRALGAEVRVCAPADEEFAKLLDRVGVELVPAADPVRAVVTGTASPLPGGLPQRAAAILAAQYEAVGAAADGCDAVVATGLLPAAAGARLAAERAGVPYAFVAFFPGYLPSTYLRPLTRPGQTFPPEVTDIPELHDLDAQFMNEAFGTGLNLHRASLGLPPVDDFRGYVLTGRPFLAADPVLAPWQEPTALDVVQTGAWILPDDRPLPDELTAFLEAGEPPVYVGFGSMPMGGTDVARVAVEAVRAHGRRVLVGRGWADLALIDDRDDCFAVGEVNHQALFGRLAAVVHHGGAGTTTTAARAGVPQVVVPQLADQPYWAGRVAELGIGAAHEGPTPTVESLSAALGTALAAETRERARAVADAVRTDGATVAAKHILDIVGQERTTASG
ncbi:vancomycin aglycone glucosyltransferase [Streptomyces canus]|uniref:glycosyltransferase n=1 Tax=Streptomyces canus TaxID=58343 RepID=UPI002783D874|nr:glycosyltransferase [Streptomyces canus]MDQ0597063.1 vancomycin aglycone glucosyltransferase [Streptomyces canus]